MTKYKIVGLVNIVLGSLLGFGAFVSSQFIIPSFNLVISGFTPPTSSQIAMVYLLTIAILLHACVDLFLGVKCFTESNNKEKYFNYGIFSIISSFILPSIFIAILTIYITSPVYNQVSQF